MKKLDYSDYGIEYETENSSRIEFDHRSTPYQIASQIQKATDEIISNCPRTDWNENLITYKLIENLRHILSNYKLLGIPDIFPENKFYLEAYKLTGKAEQSHGDIAIVVTRKFTNREELTSGVAFYEAKASGAARYMAVPFILRPTTSPVSNQYAKIKLFTLQQGKEKNRK